MVLTFDGKGIVMRPGSLRECTKKKAKKSQKLNSRLSAGEKKHRKRMAQVASVYTVLPHHRSAESIMKCDENNVSTVSAPARNKRVWPSVEREAKEVIFDGFKEALQRDPKQARQWVVVMDFIHVLEYLWKAAWCFFDKGDETVEAWISKYAIKLLKGGSSQVAKGLRQSATKRKLTRRDAVDSCAKYLLNNTIRPWQQGFPSP